MDQELFRCDEGDPNRCQGITKTGQCPFKAHEGLLYCKMHAGQSLKKLEKQEIRNYRLAQWQGRINEFADNDKVKSLREEVGVLRLTLESILDKCKDTQDLLIYAGKICALVLNIEKVVSSCHRLELSTGALLDKTAVVQIAGTIVEIIGRHIRNPDQVSMITSEIMVSISQVQVSSESQRDLR
jgi:hypothetical protein